MTSNQVNYWSNEEKKRANRASEALTKREQDLNKEIKDRQMSQKDVELAMANLDNYLKHGKRGDLSYAYGINAAGQSGNTDMNPMENAYGSAQSIIDYYGELLGGILPDITLKL